MDYKAIQQDYKRRSRRGSFFTNLGTHNIFDSGLLGTERQVLKNLFGSDKEPVLVDKLTNLQKKVVRKMKWTKHIFLKASQTKLNTNKS